MVELIERVDHPCFRTLPDYGNFPPEIVLDGMEKLLPYAVNLHVKWRMPDSEARRDVPALFRLLKGHGFDGTLMIEDGGQESDHRGVLELKGALMACMNSPSL